MQDNQIDKQITQELEKATAGIFISSELRSRIKAETIKKPRTRIDILKDFLNLKIEIPLIPIVATVAIVVVLAFTPLQGFQQFHGYSEIVVPSQYETIHMGGTSIIVDKNAEGDDVHVNF